jgi:ribokinase
LPLISVLLVNEGEAEALLGITADDLSGTGGGAITKLAKRGVQRAVITLGSEGALVVEQTATQIAATPVAAVDTTGAGDAFTGALASAIDAGEDLRTAATHASRYAAATTLRAGAQASYPDLTAIDALLG